MNLVVDLWVIDCKYPEYEPNIPSNIRSKARVEIIKITTWASLLISGRKIRRYVETPSRPPRMKVMGKQPYGCNLNRRKKVSAMYDPNTANDPWAKFGTAVVI